MRFDQGTHKIEYLSRMSARRHVVESAAQAKIVVEYERRARRVFALEHAERGSELPSFVGKQDEWERVLLRECLMTLGRIRTHADDYAVQRFELLEAVAELLGLDGAPRSIVH